MVIMLLPSTGGDVENHTVINYVGNEEAGDDDETGAARNNAIFTAY